jgi:regulator of RNase E activity RraA
MNDVGEVRVRPPDARVAAETLARLSAASASLVVDQGADCLWLAAPLRPLGRGPANARVCGPALTVSVPAGDNVALRVAIERAQPGDVLLIAGKGYLGRALIGEIMARRAIARGVAGFVIDGAVRDTARLAELPVPVFCRGSALTRATKLGSGEVGYPVAIASEVIYPGDVGVGDQDGVAIIRREAAERVATLIEHGIDYEAARNRAAEDGDLDLTLGFVGHGAPLAAHTEGFTS